MMKFEEIYKYDIFANEMGITLDELNDDHAIMSIKIERRHLNGGGVTHGGVLATLGDIAMAAAANQRQIGSVSIQSDVRYLAASFEGDTLTAEATAVFGRKSFSNCHVTITNQSGDMIAIAEGIYYAKRSFKVNE